MGLSSGPDGLSAPDPRPIGTVWTPRVVMEGGAMSAAAVGFARMRPRRARVRREPIDLEQLAAEFAESPTAPEPPAPRIGASTEILARARSRGRAGRRRRAESPTVVDRRRSPSREPSIPLPSPLSSRSSPNRAAPTRRRRSPATPTSRRSVCRSIRCARGSTRCRKTCARSQARLEYLAGRADPPAGASTSSSPSSSVEHSGLSRSDRAQRCFGSRRTPRARTRGPRRGRRAR